MILTQKNFRVSSVQWPKREFDPGNKQDLLVYKQFLETGSWSTGCPFVVEWPFLSVIGCIEDKIVKYHIDSLIKSAKKV
jgi:hypothetical protein